MSDYDAGREGRQFEGHMDLKEYNRGERDRKEAEAAIAAIIPTPKPNPVPGVAFTILIIAPFLYLVYPVLGLTLLAVFSAVVLLFYFTTLPPALEIIAGLVICVFSFFPAYKLEAKASQFKTYRFLRGAFRLLNFCVLPVVLLSLSDTGNLTLDTNTATGATLFASIIVALIVFFVFRTLDRLYFPVWAEVEKMAEQQAKGIPFRRNLLKRVIYSLVWIIPVMLVMNLLIRILVDNLMEGPLDVMDFYDQYSIVVYVVDLAVWLLLCIAGILPGTARTRKSFIDHEELLKQSGRS
jgi:hypothetical protein